MPAGWMRRQGCNGAEGSQSTGNAQPDTAGLLRFGSILATIGCALLGAGVVDPSASTFAVRANVEAIRDVPESGDISTVVSPEADHGGQDHPQAASQEFGGTARCDVRAELRQVPRPEVTDMATIPVAQDPRESLAVMAVAARHRGGMTLSCPCPMGVPSYRASLVNSDDRIANALFGPRSDGGKPASLNFRLGARESGSR
jgi:hypothetical protein